MMSGVCVLQMDKASIIKDAIDYIQYLHEQEKIIQAEIMDLESGMPKKSSSSYDFEQEQLPVVLRSKKKRTEQIYDSVGSRNSPIEVLDVNPLLSLSCIIDSIKMMWGSGNLLYEDDVGRCAFFVVIRLNF